MSCLHARANLHLAESNRKCRRLSLVPVWVSHVSCLIQKISAACKAPQSPERWKPASSKWVWILQTGYRPDRLLLPSEASASPLTANRPSWGHLGPQPVLPHHRAALRTHPCHVQPNEKPSCFTSYEKLCHVKSRIGPGGVFIRLHTLAMAKKKAHWALWMWSNPASWSLLMFFLPSRLSTSFQRREAWALTSRFHWSGARRTAEGTSAALQFQSNHPLLLFSAVSDTRLQHPSYLTRLCRSGTSLCGTHVKCGHINSLGNMS